MKPGKRTAYLFLSAVLGIAILASIILMYTKGQSSTPSQEPFGYDDFIEKLYSSGAAIEITDQITQPYLSIQGKVVMVNGKEVKVFEYPDAATLEAEASTISSDAGYMGATRVSWNDKPNFYKKGRMLVIYLGSDAEIMRILEGILGKMFAG